MNASRIRCPAHQPVKRVDLPHKVPLADPANRRVARHFADRGQRMGQQQCPRAQPGRRRRRLAASMPATNDNDLKLFLHAPPSATIWRPSPSAVGQNGPTVLPAVYGPAFFDSDLGLFKNFQIKESMKLQFRIQATNFLNHPLWSMSQGNALNLSFSQATPGGPLTMNNPQFGTAQYKTGQRIVELQAKFFF
jgi:hypothetical protein